MIKIILGILTTFVFCVNAYAETISIDARGKCYPLDHPEEQSQFSITFHGTAASLENNSPGHAYIVLNAPKDAFQKVCLPKEGHGQNPKEKSLSALFEFEFNMKDGIKFKIKEGGVIKENLAKLESIHSLEVRVTKRQFDDTYALIQKWKTEDYILTRKDCIDFIIEVAKSIDLINVPERKIAKQLPSDYLKALVAHNKEI